MDTCIRRNLVQLAALRTGEQIDLPQLALGLLVGIFKSDFPNEKLYMKWKTRQVIMNCCAFFLLILTQLFDPFHGFLGLVLII